MIPPGRALRDIRTGLREGVMPELESDHARSILASALGILDELAARVQLDSSPPRQTAVEVIAALPGWESRLAAAGSAAVERVSGLRACAEAALASDPPLARERALEAAEAVITAGWNELDEDARDALLGEVRKLTRADVERQKGKR